MGRSQQVKSSFQSGVLSPRLSLRSDLEKYQSALERSVNFIPNPQGGMVMREGFQFMLDPSLNTAPNRIFQFHKGGDQSDMLIDVTADGTIHYHVDGVTRPEVGSHSYLQSELDELYFTNQEKTGVICHANHPPLYIEIGLSGEITAEPLESRLIAFTDYKDSNSPSATINGDTTYTIEFVDGDVDLWTPSRNFMFSYNGIWAVGSTGIPVVREYSNTSNKLINRLLRMLELIPELNGPGTGYSIVPVGAADATRIYDITITGPNSGFEMVIVTKKVNADRYVTIDSTTDVFDILERAWSYPTYVFHGANYYQSIKPNVGEAGINEPINSTYWVDLGTTKPDTFDWQYPDGADWTEGNSYSPGDRGFPTVAVIHQQRLILMANPSFTMGVFGSRINNYKDFIRGPQDDDPFIFAIDTSDTPTIKWAESQRHLIIGTSSGDYNLTAQVTLAPSDVSALKQNNARSNASKAITINTDVFYIEQGREKIRATSYVDDLNSNSSSDISLIAEHLLNVRAKRIVLMQTPEVVAFVLREDGSLLGISYSHELGTGAWYEFASQGVVTDIAVQYTTTTDEDELWATVTYDGGITHHIEKMPYPKRVFTVAREIGDPFFIDQDLVCLDGWIKGSMVQGDHNVIQGLEQFEGLTVGCLVEDAWTGEYQVQDGAIILDAADIEDNYSGSWAVGFRYTATAKTFEMSAGNQRGTGLGTNRRWNKLYIKTLDSALPVINGTLPPDRKPESLMGMADIIQSGLQDIDIRNIGWDDGAITIVQNRPYPCNIIGFFGEFSSNNA